MAARPVRPARSERVYRSLLRAYPAGFRQRFGDDMVQLFGDQLRDARTAGTPTGHARIWMRTLMDLAVTAASEHARRDRKMAHSLEAPSGMTRALGMAGVVGGLAILAVFVIGKLIFEDMPALITVRILLFNLGAIGVAVGIGRRWAAAGMGGGRRSAAVWAVVLGNAWYAGMIVLPVVGWAPFAGDGHVVGDLAAVAMWLSGGLFGLVVARDHGLLRIAGLALALGSIFALLGMDRWELVRGDLASLFIPLTIGGQGVIGVAWLLLGADLLTRPQPRPVPAADAPGAAG